MKLRKRILALTAAVVLALPFAAIQEAAAKDTDSEPAATESEYVYTGLGNKVKRKDEELAQKYQQGITMEPEQVQARKERVKELGLEKEVDDRYFLPKEYYHQYSISELEQKGLTLLIECMTEEDIEEWENQLQSGTAPRYIQRSSDLIAWTDTTGATVRTHAFDVDGHVAFCGDHDKTAPPTGTSHSSYITVTNSQIQKFLYYGYAGPDDRMTQAGYSRAKGYCLMAFSIDKLRKGERLGTSGTAFWNMIKDLPAPSSGTACYVDTYQSDLQDLFFYSMPTKGKLQIQKTSANPELTNGNSCYSLEGAQFGVYTNANGVSGHVGTLTSGSDGNTGTLELDAGTYYVKELVAPTGFALDSSVKEVTVSADQTTTFTFADKPQLDPVGVLLGKVDAETNKNKPEGSATLGGAQFTTKFYAGLWEKDQDPAMLGQNPMRTWVFQTDEDGWCEYDKTYLVSGDELYISPSGEPSLPIGTITIQETKAPEGYLLNPEVFVRQITTAGDAEWVNTYNQPVIPENILKLDLVKKQAGTDIAIPGAEFEHTKPDGTKEVLKTNEEGKLTFKGLQYGDHILRELSVMDGYMVNENAITFTVAEDNQITLTSSVDEYQGKVDFTVTEEGNISVVVEDKLAPFHLLLHKVNEKEKQLAGAEFTLYADKKCETEVQTGVTAEGGLLQMDGLEVGKTYYLKETKAPKGYRIPVDLFGNDIIYEIRVESTPVQDVFTFYVDGKAYDSNSDPDGMFTVGGTKADREVHMTIVNTTGRRLPDTGSSRMPLLFFGGSILFVLAVFCYKTSFIWKRRVKL